LNDLLVSWAWNYRHFQTKSRFDIIGVTESISSPVSSVAVCPFSNPSSPLVALATFYGTIQVCVLFCFVFYHYMRFLKLNFH
jgi:hypothetical protein